MSAIIPSSLRIMIRTRHTPTADFRLAFNTRKTFIPEQIQDEAIFLINKLENEFPHGTELEKPEAKVKKAVKKLLHKIFRHLDMGLGREDRPETITDEILTRVNNYKYKLLHKKGIDLRMPESYSSSSVNDLLFAPHHLQSGAGSRHSDSASSLDSVSSNSVYNLENLASSPHSAIGEPLTLSDLVSPRHLEVSPRGLDRTISLPASDSQLSSEAFPAEGSTALGSSSVYNLDNRVSSTHSEDLNLINRSQLFNINSLFSPRNSGSVDRSAAVMSMPASDSVRRSSSLANSVNSVRPASSVSTNSIRRLSSLANSVNSVSSAPPDRTSIRRLSSLANSASSSD